MAKFVKFRDAATVSAAKAASAEGDGTVHIVRDEQALVYEGNEIQGLNTWQQGYLKQKQEEEVLSKLTVAVSLSPSSGSEFTGEDVSLAVTATIKFNGVLQDVSRVTLGNQSGKVTLTKSSTGVYTGTKTLMATSAVNGKLSYSDKLYVTYEGLVKEVAVNFVQYAPLKFVSGDVCEGSAISSSTMKYVKASAGGSYTLNVTPDKYLFICLPPFMSLSSVKSSGFDVPLEAVVSTNVIIGNVNMGYKVYRTSGKPQSTPMSIVIA